MSIVVPFEQLPPATLDAVIEEFVTRDGAIHGHADIAMQTQAESVRRQLRAGRVVLVYDEETESCTIVPADQRPG